MTTDYTVGLKDSSGNDRDAWTDFIKLSYGRKLNDLGRLSCTMPIRAGINPVIVRRDYHLVIYRSVDGATPYLDMDTWWIIDSVDWDIDNHVVTFEAGDLLHILKRRIVGYTSQTPYADKTFVELAIAGRGLLTADDMMKEYVSQNIGPTAIDSVRTIAAITIQPDVSLAPNAELQGAWRELIQVCQDIANQSAGLGTNIYFDIVPVGSRTFEFRVYNNVRRMNRSSSGPNPTYFSSDTNLVDTHLRWDYRDEKTHWYLSGEGAGAGVLYTESGDTSRDYSLWGRIEGYANLGGEAGDTTNYFPKKQAEKLRGSRPKLVMTANVKDVDGSIYGKDYHYGDVFGATAEGYVFDAVINAVSVDVDGSGQSIKTALRGEITL